MNPPSRHIGRKILYVTAIVLSVLVLLLSTAGIVGGWIIKNKLSQATVALMQVVYTSAGSARQVTQLIDQGAGEVSQITSEVSQISLQISQNVEDEGLIALVLPEEKESQLAAQISEIREKIGTVREALTASPRFGRHLWRHIHANGASGRPHFAAGDEHVEPAARAQVQHHFARLQRGQRVGITV